MDNKKVAGGLLLGFLSVIILGVILAFVVFGNGEKGTDDQSNEVSDAGSVTETETEQVQESEVLQIENPEEETQEESSFAGEENDGFEYDRTLCYGEWKPVKVTDGFTGEKISFSEAFGNDFYEIENRLILSEDGTFSLALGTVKSEDEGHGTFEVFDDRLEVEYASGKTDIFLLTKDGSQNILSISVPKYNFTVYFERS